MEAIEKIIKITCTGTKLIDINSLTPIQNNLKDKSKEQPNIININYSTDMNGCHIYQGSLDSDGYARRYIKGKTRRLARIVLQNKLGREIRLGLMALHKCNNRACINPEHLYEGNNSDNMKDRYLAGHHPSGEKGSLAKLTAQQVLEIRSHFESGKIVDEIVSLYPVSRAQLYRIKSEECWKTK